MTFLHPFHMKAQRRILQISWYDFLINDSVRETTKHVDLPLVIDDRRRAILGHIIRLLKKHRLIPCYSMLSTSQMEVTLQQDGSIHHGKHGYNKSSRIRTVTLT